MCSMSVVCPLCAHTSFNSIDALRVSLIKAANGPLPCPICQESFLGLDKLTIHLFSHTNLMTSAVTAAPAAVHDHKATTPSVVSMVNGDERKVKTAKQQQFVMAPQQNEGNAMATPPLACDICEFTFRNEQLRDMHFRLVHQTPRSTAEDGTSGLGAATKCATNFKCHLCPKAFKSMGSLRVHMKVVHTVGLSGLSGGVEGNATKFSLVDRIRREAKGGGASQALQQQLRQEHQQQRQEQQQQHQRQEQQPQRQEQQQQQSQPLQPQLVLSSVGAANSTPSSFSIGSITLLQGSGGELLHSSADGSAGNVLLLINTTPNVATENDSENSGTLTAKGIGDNPKIWECDVCSKSFTTKYFLKKHKRLHTGEMPYTCEICSRTFTFQQSYHKHLLYHSDEKPHACHVCTRAFKELSTLQNHLRIHSGEKPFKCEVCGKCFRQRVSFLVHTRIHTGVMPYKCEVCDKSFRYKVSQRNHKCVPKTQADEPCSEPVPTEPAPENASEPKDELTEHILKAFLENASSQCSPTTNEEIAAICAKSQMSDEALLSQTIDDIVVESCNKLGISSQDTMPMQAAIVGHESRNARAQRQHLAATDAGSHNDCNDGSNSPSQKFQNMRLYSPQLLSELDTMVDGMGGFPRFLLDDV